MAIVKMKKLRLLALRSQQDELLDRLQKFGCVQVEPPEPVGAEEAALVLPGADRVEQCRRDKAAIERALALLDKYAFQKSKMFVKRPVVPMSEYFDPEPMRVALEDAAELEKLDEAIRKVAEQESRARGVIESLTPWEKLDLPMDTRGTETCSLAFGAVPNSMKTDPAEALGESGALAELIPVSEDEDRKYFLLLSRKEDEGAALEALRLSGFSQIAPPAVKGTAAQNIEELEAKLEELAAKREQLTAVAEEFSDRRESLRRSLDRANTRLERAEAAAMMPGTESAVLLQGWLTAPDEEKLAELLKDFTCAWETEDPAPEEAPDVPVKLKNNKITNALNMVTEMYSLPAYDGLDPNPLMAPFFILFYGIMMADMGYGLLMMLAGAIITKKYKPKGSSGHMFSLMFWCGISTFVFGALTGGFFGDWLTQIVLITSGKDFALPALFTPLGDTLMILIGCMALGAVQIITGMAISFIQKLRKRQYLDALFDEFTWWVVFAGAALAILKVTMIVLWIGVAMVVIGPLIRGKGMGKITGIFASIYSNVTGYFGDILSYSRLMALMLAGSVIAQVFNTLGAIAGNIIVFLIISIVGNILNFGLNLLGCYVHDLRLQCLEYFGKFYKDGGKPFRPLAVNTKYVDVE